MKKINGNTIGKMMIEDFQINCKLKFSKKRKSSVFIPDKKKVVLTEKVYRGYSLEDWAITGHEVGHGKHIASSFSWILYKFFESGLFSIALIYYMIKTDAQFEKYILCISLIGIFSILQTYWREGMASYVSLTWFKANKDKLEIDDDDIETMDKFYKKAFSTYKWRYQELLRFLIILSVISVGYIVYLKYFT